MRSASITPQDVAKVANQLIKTGQNPTIAAVRHGLGDRGSNSTIQKYLAEWRESFQEGTIQELPASLPEELMKPFEEIFTTAVDVARKQHDDERKEFESKIEAMQGQLDEMASKLTSATTENARLYDGHEHQHQVISDLTEKNTRLETALESQTKLAEQREADLLEERRLAKQREVDFAKGYERLEASHHEEITRFKIVVDDYKSQLAKETDRYNDQNVYWAKQVDQARTEGDRRADKLEQQILNLEQKVEAERGKKEAVQSKQAKTSEQVATQQVMIETLSSEMSELKSTLEGYQAEQLKLRESNASLTAEKAAKQEIIVQQKAEISRLLSDLLEAKKVENNKDDSE